MRDLNNNTRKILSIWIVSSIAHGTIERSIVIDYITTITARTEKTDTRLVLKKRMTTLTINLI